MNDASPANKPDRKPFEAHPWIEWKTEYVKGPIAELTDFFKAKGIAVGTWQKRTRGWRAARSQHLENIYVKTIQKASDVESDRLVRHLKLGKALMATGVRALAEGKQQIGQEIRDVKLVINSVDEARQLIRTGAEIERKIVELEEEIKELRAQGNRPADVATTVVVQMDDKDRLAVRMYAKQAGRERALRSIG